jgi:signal transduction histidine kinase
MAPTILQQQNQIGTPVPTRAKTPTTSPLPRTDPAILHRANIQVLLNAIPRCAFIKDPHCSYLACNQQFATLMDTSVSAVAGKTNYDFLPEEIAEAIQADDQRIMQRGIAEEFIETLLFNGQETTIQLSKSPLIGDTGEVIGLLVIFLQVKMSKLTEESLRVDNKMLRQFSAHLQEVREQERQAVGREIHDNLGQRLTALSFDIAWLKRRSSALDPDFIEHLERMAIDLKDTMQIVHEISSNLRPPMLDDLGLNAAIINLLTDISRRSGIHYTVDLDPTIALQSEHLAHIYRIAQEAITNVMRHAGATNIHVTLHRQGKGCMLKITDNGKGITTRNLQMGGRFGLLGMRERAELLGGTLEIKGRRNQGTNIILQLPMGCQEDAPP